MRARNWFGVVLGLVLAGPLPAAAQSAEGEPGQAPGWTFTPAVAVGWLWDSNVGMVTEGFNQDIRDDNVLTVSPAGSLSFLGRQTNFGLGYSGTVRRYTDVSELNSYEQRVRLTFAHRPTARLMLFARENFARLPTTDETELNGVPYRRMGSRLNSASGGFEYRLTKLSTLKAAYEFVDIAFDHELEQPTFVLGGRSNGVTSEFTRRLTERIALGAIYEIRFAEVKTALVDAQPLRYQIAGASSRYTLGPTTTILFAGGISTLSDPGLDETSIGPFIRAGITQHLQRATIDVGYERSFVPTFGFAASTQTEQLHGSVVVPVYRNRVYVQASSSWRRNDPLLENESSLTSFFTTATVGYAVARPVRIEGFYTAAWQDTPVAGGQVNRHRVGAQVVLSSPVRVR